MHRYMSNGTEAEDARDEIIAIAFCSKIFLQWTAIRLQVSGRTFCASCTSCSNVAKWSISVDACDKRPSKEWVLWSENSEQRSRLFETVPKVQCFSHLNDSSDERCRLPMCCRSFIHKVDQFRSSKVAPANLYCSLYETLLYAKGVSLLCS